MCLLCFPLWLPRLQIQPSRLQTGHLSAQAKCSLSLNSQPTSTTVFKQHLTKAKRSLVCQTYESSHHTHWSSALKLDGHSRLLFGSCGNTSLSPFNCSQKLHLCLLIFCITTLLPWRCFERFCFIFVVYLTCTYTKPELTPKQFQITARWY